MSTAQRIQLPDGSIVNLPGGGSKEWQLFQTVTGDGETLNFSWDNLDFTEFLFIATGIYNNSTSLTSAVNIAINDIKIGALDSQKDGGTIATRNQVLHVKYNELFWENFRGSQSNNAEDYYVSYGIAYVPYAFRTNIGKCTKLSLISNSPAYCWAGGTIQIYAR